MSRIHVLTRFWWAFLAVGASVVILGVGLPALTSHGADHVDAPGVFPTSPGGDGRLDITDVYAFQAPNDPANVVLIMDVSPLAGVLSPGTLRPGAKYEFAIDTDGDALEDIVYRLQASAPNKSGIQRVNFRMVGGDGVLATGPSEAIMSVEGGGSLFVGLRDDPFFIDLDAFFDEILGIDIGAAGRTLCDGGEVDFFAGSNVSAIVLELPRATLGSDIIGVWGRTVLDDVQVDRMGRPNISTVFIPSGSKNAFNAGEPADDVADFSGFLGAFAGLLLPDILTIDTSDPAGFLNGRGLVDDVVDIELALVTGGAITTDCVGTNDVAFLDNEPDGKLDFPYLAPAH